MTARRDPFSAQAARILACTGQVSAANSETGRTRKPRLVLSEVQNAALWADIAIHDRMREQMAPHTKDVLAAEFGLSPGGIQYMEKKGFSQCRKCQIPAKVYGQVKRRREIYWKVRAPYVQRYSFMALMRRYGISRSALKQRINEYRDRPKQAERVAA